MTHVTRKEIFAQAAKKLRHDFEELKATILHAGLKGGEAEDLVRKFLQGHCQKDSMQAAGSLSIHSTSCQSRRM
jgi:hypothetical protein